MAATASVAELARTRRKGRQADALSLLGWLTDERSVPALASALRDLGDRDPDLAYVASQSLSEYDSELACRYLMEALQIGYISRPLVATLIETSSFAPEVVARARRDPDPDVRSWVAYLLGRSRSAHAGTWLESLAADPEPEVRASAAEALAEFPETAILESLLSDPPWLVRANAAKAIGDADVTTLAPHLTPLLRDRVWWVRQSATLALKRLGASSVAAVLPMLEDDDQFARNEAAEVLIDLGYVSQQIAALGSNRDDGVDASRRLGAVARAGARSTITGSAGGTSTLTRQRLDVLLAEWETPR